VQNDGGSFPISFIYSSQSSSSNVLLCRFQRNTDRQSSENVVVDFVQGRENRSAS
jgi:hypothetical protein